MANVTDPNKPRVVVTGASGHIGANLVRELAGRGYRVSALVRESSRALDGIGVQKIAGDILDLQSLRGAFRGADQVYHLAAFTSMQPGDYKKMESVNIEGTKNVLRACRSEGVSTLAYFSSTHALQQAPGDRAVTEQSPLISRKRKDAGVYEYSKAMADRTVRDCDNTALSTRILYPSAVIGPNDFELSLMGQAILKMARSELPVLVNGAYDWVDARDVSRGAVEAVEKGSGGDRYILSGHRVSISGFAGLVAELTGGKAPSLTCPTWLAKFFAPAVEKWAAWRGETPMYTRDALSAMDSPALFSHSLATEQLGYRPRPFRRSVQDALLDYAKSHEVPGMKFNDG